MRLAGEKSSLAPYRPPYRPYRPSPLSAPYPALRVGATEIAIPRAQSMTLSDALTWQVAQVEKIPQLINKNASVREQAIQAVTLKNGFISAARNAMQNSGHSAQLSLVRPIRSFNEMVEARSKEFGGDVLYKKVMLDALQEAKIARRVDIDGYCFAAGTFVHTENGLVPIENIRIGDRVLSQPEEGGGELSYQSVLRTTVSDEEQPLWLVSYGVVDSSSPLGGRVEAILATANHPFWVKGIGWTRADELLPSVEIEVSNGLPAYVENSTPLVRTENPNVAWIDIREDQGLGLCLVFEGAKFHTAGTLIQPPHGFGKDGFVKYPKSVLFRRKVYNFEVANTHTYYVGELGVWVHNTNCNAYGVKFYENRRTGQGRIEIE